MFSSSFINTAAPGSSHPPTHHHQHQQRQVSSYSDVLFPDHHHYTDVVPGMAQQHNHVATESTITFITPFSNTSMDKQPGSVARVTKKKSDKRSKIRTSQGLRDRRVRLSIEIARNFFDLQDLLGFDKPSRTVEWLLTKSSKAILELSGASSSTTSSEAARTEDGFKSLSSSRSTATCSTDQLQQASSDDSLKTMKQKVALLTRESRKRARVRARARTLAKLWTSKLHNNEIRPLNCHNLSMPPLSKASTFSVRQEEKRKEEEQRKQTQQLQIHNYVPKPDLPLDWDISSVTSLPSSSATNRLNLSRDVENYATSSWDQLILHNYRTL